MRRRAAAALLTLAFAAACSGGDDTADETTVTPEPTTETTPASTTVPPTTAATTTTPPTTQATTTTSSPPSSAATTDPIDPEVAAFEAVVAAAEESWHVFNTALMSPNDDEAVAALSDVYTERLVAGWMSIVEEYRTNDYRLVESQDEPASQTVSIPSIIVDAEEGVASLQVCTINTFIKVQSQPDGTDVVIDDGVTRQVEALDLIRVGDVWKVDSARIPDDDERIAACD